MSCPVLSCHDDDIGHDYHDDVDNDGYADKDEDEK